MANVAAQLGNLLAVNADINFYTQMQLYWSHMYEANQEKLQEQVKCEEKWESAYDSALGNERELKAGGIVVQKDNQSERLADAYAHSKVSKYNVELSMELAELDIEYDTIKTALEAQLELLRAQKDADKQSVSTAAQDTGLLGQ